MTSNGDWRKTIVCKSECEMIKELCSFFASEIRKAIETRQTANVGVSGNSLFGIYIIEKF